VSYARIGIYRLNGSDEVAREIVRRAEQGLLPIFRRHSGFIDYELIHSGDTLISVSNWRTLEHANASVLEAAAWVLENLADEVALLDNYVGKVALSSRE
jgi:heme-degrading monooxygenase HmoA